MSKILTVFGATGSQGGSVIGHILADQELSREFRVRAITRDTSKPSAKALADKGVELATADLNSRESVVKALQGSHTVFLVTNYWESTSKEVEIGQGKNVADAALEVGVQYLIFSSLLHVTNETKGRLRHVPHFDGKAEVEQYIRDLGIPSTFMLPGYYMANLSSMIQKLGDDSYTLQLPISGDSKLPLFATHLDTGRFVTAILKHKEFLLGKQVLAATAYYTPQEIMDIFGQVQGTKATFVQVSSQEYLSFMPPPIAREYLENHLFIQDPGYYNGASLNESLHLLSERPTTWRDFVTASGMF